MQVWVSTVIRHSAPDQRSGRVMLVDLAEEAHVVREVVVPESRWRYADPNPRGGTRGFRWVAAWGNRLVVPSYSAIHVIDPDGRVERSLEHPLMGYIHCVRPDDDGVWVAATASDRVLRLDWSGELVQQWCATDSGLLSALGDVAMPDELIDYRDPGTLATRVHGVTQLNCLVLQGDQMWVSLGMVLVHANSPSLRSFDEVRPPGWRPPAGHLQTHHAIVRLDHGLKDGEVVWHRPTHRWPNHDLMPHGEAMWFSDTDGGCVQAIDGSPQAVEGDFVRGMLSIDGRLLVATQAPLRIHEIGADRTWNLPGLDNESITCLATP